MENFVKNEEVAGNPMKMKVYFIANKSLEIPWNSKMAQQKPKHSKIKQKGMRIVGIRNIFFFSKELVHKLWLKFLEN
jgi:hypothetical protein